MKSEKEIRDFHLDLINKQRKKRREELIKERRIRDAVASNMDPKPQNKTTAENSKINKQLEEETKNDRMQNG